jgi:HD-GYP domain-containing protein (c-di-GMP phosphodiesterase class II)
VIAHHERFDGTGYPRGLRGDVIPVGARIFAVADTLDAMISDRPYRSSRTYQQARAEIAGAARTQFDPLVTAGFLRIPEEEWAAIRECSLHRAVRVEGAR